MYGSEYQQACLYAVFLLLVSEITKSEWVWSPWWHCLVTSCSLIIVTELSFSLSSAILGQPLSSRRLWLFSMIWVIKFVCPPTFSTSVTLCVCLCFVGTTFSEEVPTKVGPYDSAVSGPNWPINMDFILKLNITKLTVIWLKFCLWEKKRHFCLGRTFLWGSLMRGTISVLIHKRFKRVEAATWEVVKVGRKTT